MTVMIIGAAASGKSSFAEDLCAVTGGESLYIATMRPDGAEARARISKHRSMRAGKPFDTLEFFAPIAELKTPGDKAYGGILLECAGNILAEQIFTHGEQPENAARGLMDAVERLAGKSERMVVVTNDVFDDGARYDLGTRRYLDSLAAFNRMLASRADSVAEVVCGLPVPHKGEELLGGERQAVLSAIKRGNPDMAEDGILIIGGAGQGKHTRAAELWSAGELQDGGVIPLEEALRTGALTGLHLLVRRLLEVGEAPLEFIEKRLEKRCGWIIVCDEIGCGVVPIDAQERLWRETVGRICCELAVKARVVERMFCGLPQRLKG